MPSYDATSRVKAALFGWVGRFTRNPRQHGHLGPPWWDVPHNFGFQCPAAIPPLNCWCTEHRRPAAKDAARDRPCCMANPSSSCSAAPVSSAMVFRRPLGERRTQDERTPASTMVPGWLGSTCSCWRHSGPLLGVRSSPERDTMNSER